MTDDVTVGAIGFEAVKVSMSQDKNGVILRLSIHPNDCPKELHTDWVGTRYMVGMVRLNDDDTPDDRGYAQKQKMVAAAGLLCRNADFYTFLSQMGLVVPNPQNEAAKEFGAVAALHEYCGIRSRAELVNNEEARVKFEALRQSFKNWKEGKPWKTTT